MQDTIAHTDDLCLEMSLQQRLRSSQQTLIEAIRQRDQSRLECQRLTLAMQDQNTCRARTISALIERLREILSPEPFTMSELLHVAIDCRNWPNNWYLIPVLDLKVANPDGEEIEVHFSLVCYTPDRTATYEAFRVA